MLSRFKKHLRKTRRGFTLPEILVAIACASVLLLGVCSAFVFFSDSGNSTVKNASAIYKLPVIRDYITANAGTSDVSSLSGRFTVSDGTVKDMEKAKIIADGTEVDSITFKLTEDGLIKCDITSGDYHYIFTLSLPASTTDTNP